MGGPYSVLGLKHLRLKVLCTVRELETLLEHGLVRRGRPVKILGDGDAPKGLQVKAHKFSRTAREKIEAAGGSCEEL